MILDMNMVARVVCDLNKELHYKISETKRLAGNAEDYDFLVYVSNGEHTTIKFMGIEIWNSKISEMIDNPTPEQQLLRTREDFEAHVRQLIQDELAVLERVIMV